MFERLDFGITNFRSRSHSLIYQINEYLTCDGEALTQRQKDFFQYTVPSLLYAWLELKRGTTPSDGGDSGEAQLTPFSALTAYQAATVFACAEANTGHVAAQLVRQFPGMAKKLECQPGEDVKKATKRIHDHIVHTREAALDAMHLKLRDVRRLLMGTPSRPRR